MSVPQLEQVKLLTFQVLLCLQRTHVPPLVQSTPPLVVETILTLPKFSTRTPAPPTVLRIPVSLVEIATTPADTTSATISTGIPSASRKEIAAPDAQADRRAHHSKMKDNTNSIEPAAYCPDYDQPLKDHLQDDHGCIAIPEQ